jgi:N-acetylglutamate synthase-like GNAT family acetyltransferase
VEIKEAKIADIDEILELHYRYQFSQLLKKIKKRVL